MAKKTEMDYVREELRAIAEEKAMHEEALARLKTRMIALGQYAWTLPEAVDEDGHPTPSIDLGGCRIDRKVTPVYSLEGFAKDCSKELDAIRSKHAMDALDKYNPTQTEIEAVFTARQDGEILKLRHTIGSKTVFALTKPSKED